MTKFSQLEALMVITAINHIIYIELQRLYKVRLKSIFIHSKLPTQITLKREIVISLQRPILPETQHQLVLIVCLLT